MVMPIADCLSVIGAGRIGQTIIRALLKSGYGRILGTARRDRTLSRIREIGVEATRDNAYAVREADTVILSVKPYHLIDVLREVPSNYWRGRLVVSVIAGVSLATLRKHLRGAEVYRAMPNINALVGRSSTALASDGLDGERKGEVEDIFSRIGKVYWVREELLDAWTGVVGSGPAYIAEIIDGLVLGGLAVGLPRDLIFESILDVLEGTAKLLREKRIHPVEMRDEVTTPGGTTIKGLSVLEAEAVKSALIKAVEEATKRSMDISRHIDETINRMDYQ